MTTHEERYMAKTGLGGGRCICGKRGCGQMGYTDKLRRHTIIYRRQSTDIILFTCANGHRNVLQI